jgi:hypothetical protein
MATQMTRRHFLTAATSGVLLGLGDLSDFAHLAGAEPPKAKNVPWQLQYGAEIEPLVRLMEETPREKCVEVMAEKLRGGLTYRQFMAGVFLAGLRNGGDTGYYHCVYVVHSANQLGLDAPVGERLLALFGALDVFKDWQRPRADEPGKFGHQPIPNKLSSPDKALRQFHEALKVPDYDAAEAAIIPLVRSEARQRIFDLIAQYGFRVGGVHPWIFASNAWRCLGEIGWEHTEPVLRSLVRHIGGDLDWYQPLREQAGKTFGALPADWAQASAEPGLTRELLAVMRTGNDTEAFNLSMRSLIKGKARAGALWDAVHLAAGEAFLRGDPGNALHSNTGLNALHFAFQTAGDPETRLQVLMRAVTFMCHPRSAYPAKKSPVTITELAPLSIPESPEQAAAEICVMATKDGAVGKAFALAQRHPDTSAYWQTKRREVFMTASDAHPYKFLAAIWENTRNVSARWRPHLMAAAIGQTEGGVPPDSPLMVQAREAVRKR